MNYSSMSLIKSSKAEFLMSMVINNSITKSTGKQRVVPLKFRIAGMVLNFISLINNEWAAQKLSQIWFTVFKSQPKPWVTKFWNQADRRFEIDLQDQSIPVYCWGKGPLIVMMHGWSGSGTQFKHFIPALTEAGYSVALFDAPVHGTNPGKHSHLLDFSDSLVAIQQQIGPVDTVIAHSFGAMGVTLATHRGLMLNRMVLIGPHLDMRVIFDSYSQLLNLRSKLVERFKALASIKMADILQIEDPWELLNTKTLLHDEYLSGLLIFDGDDEEVPQSHFNEIESLWKYSESFKTTGLGHTRLLKDNQVIRKVIKYLKK